MKPIVNIFGLIARPCLFLILSFPIFLSHAQPEVTHKGQYVPAKEEPESVLKGIDIVLQKILKNHHTTGASIAIVEKSRIIYSKGFGYRNLRAREPVTPNTLFAIGSCTKAFTAALIGQLEQKKKLTLDNKVRDYLPKLHFNNETMNNMITLRDMLCHRTGLSRYERSWLWFNSSSRDSLLARIQYMKPMAGVREKWQYNNFMYMALGRVAEELTGKSWEEDIAENIFNPLDMHRSNTSIQLMRADLDAATGYGTEEGQQQTDYYEMQGMAPAGGINSTANEMAAWLSTWLNKGAYHGKEVLPPVFVEEATSSQTVVWAAQPGSNDQRDIYLLNYGLGWFIRSHRGHYEVEHDGNIDGFSSWVAFFPADSLGIVVLTNQTNSEVPQLISNTLADRLLRLKAFDYDPSAAKEGSIAKKATPAATGRVADTHPSHSNNAYPGYFENPAYGEIRVYLKGDSLFASIGKQLFLLIHYHYDVFEARRIKNSGIDTATSDLRINFRFAANGKIESISLPLEATTESTVEFVNTQKTFLLPIQQLEKYTGDYEMEGMSAKVYIKDTSLFILAAGQPEYLLIPLGNHQFTLPALPGYNIQFEALADAAATGFIFIKPDGTSFKIPKKR